ncbi:MAG TPA: hypothetical protein VE360_01860 [Pyrinomonadaceae bacterium]|nr:hypothetical protein [Pyrinomonadaceae bacterium]
MAIRRRRHKHGREGRKKHTDELSAMLAPLEELKPEMAPPPGQPEGNGDYHDATIRVDSKSVKMPERLLDEDEPREGLRIFYLEPLVLVILSIMLAFVAFVAWQITLMPAK